MSSSNVSIRSNVYLRSTKALSDDRKFVSQVRGRNALNRLVARLCEGANLLQVARRYLTPIQLAQVAWQTRCDGCGVYPEGPVLEAGKVQVRFRCPKDQCGHDVMLPTSVLVDPELVRRCCEKFDDTFPAILLRALDLINEGTHKAHRTVIRYPVPVRLSLTQRYFYSADDIDLALRRLLGDD